MTQTKIYKSIAIILAMCIAFGCLAVATTMNVFAEEQTISGSGVKYEFTVPDYKSGAPDISVKITFPQGDAAVAEDKVAENVKVFEDKDMTKEVDIKDVTPEVAYSASEITIKVPLSKAKNLETGNNYFLAVLKDVTETKKYYGTDLLQEFEVKKQDSSTNPTVAPSSTDKSTTATTKKTIKTVTVKTYTTRKTTYRTLTTRRTTTTAKRANAANTGDNSNMPLWIGLAIVACGAFGLAYVWKEN